MKEIFCLSVLLDGKSRPELTAFVIKSKKQMYEALMTINGLYEAIIIQKCNCVELYFYGDFKTKQRIIETWKDKCLDRKKFNDDLIVTYRGKRCIIHLLKTASGLKSVTLGDNQVLGQLRDAYRDSLLSKGAGPVLTSLFSDMRRIVLQVRVSTKIGADNVSVARASVDMLQNQIENRNIPILIIGAGATGSLATKSLREKLYNNISIANRTISKSDLLVEKGYADRSMPLDRAWVSMNNFDVVFLCIESVIPKDVVSSLNFKKDTIFFDLGNPKNSVYFPNHLKIHDIHTIKAWSDLILLNRKTDIDKANQIFMASLGRIISNIDKAINNSYINQNFHENSQKFSMDFIKNIKLKNDLLNETRSFFQDNGFIEIHTPCVVAVPSDPVRTVLIKNFLLVRGILKQCF